MTLVFGSPEALEIVQRDRELIKEEAERDKAAAAFGGKPLKLWKVTGMAPVECIVAAPDAETAEEIAEDWGAWDYMGGDPERFSAEEEDAKPTLFLVREATEWAMKQKRRWS